MARQDDADRAHCSPPITYEPATIFRYQSAVDTRAYSVTDYLGSAVARISSAPRAPHAVRRRRRPERPEVEVAVTVEPWELVVPRVAAARAAMGMPALVRAGHAGEGGVRQ